MSSEELPVDGVDVELAPRSKKQDTDVAKSSL